MGKGFGQFVKDAAQAIYRDVGDEFAFAVNDIREKVVEEPWFGRAVTPEAADFYRWLGPQPGDSIQPGGEDKSKEADKGDPLGRASAEPVVEAMPLEGRPSNLEERLQTAEAYARHQQAGPYGTMEMDDIRSDEWRDFEGWLDKEPAPECAGTGGITLDLEPEVEEEVEQEI